MRTTNKVFERGNNYQIIFSSTRQGFPWKLQPSSFVRTPCRSRSSCGSSRSSASSVGRRSTTYKWEHDYINWKQKCRFHFYRSIKTKCTLLSNLTKFRMFSFVLYYLRTFCLHPGEEFDHSFFIISTICHGFFVPASGSGSSSHQGECDVDLDLLDQGSSKLRLGQLGNSSVTHLGLKNVNKVYNK